MANRHWTADDAANFVKFVRSNGGDVKLPIKLTNNGGIEAEVIHPPTVNRPDWGSWMLAEFEKRR